MQRVVTKFVTVIMCIIVLVLTFSGCGKDQGGKDQDNNFSATSTSATQQTTQRVTESSANDSGDVEVDFSDLQ